jgi:hypothetical protein
MSKHWFLEMTMNAKASPLSGIISKVLEPSSVTKSARSPQELPNGVNDRMNNLYVG